MSNKRKLALKQAGPERVTPDEAEYLGTVRALLAEADEYEQQARSLDAQAVELRGAARARRGAYESYVQHLCSKYQLDPQTAEISPEGLISRPTSGAAEPQGAQELGEILSLNGTGAARS